MASIPNLSRIPSGPQLPGAYVPDDQQEEKVTESTSLLDTAKQYIPEGAQQALVNAGETAKSYLPAAVAAYIPGSTVAPAPPEHAVQSLPTHEEQGAKPYEHSEGVGALPGDVKQEAVAKLPEETAVEKSRVENEGQHETEPAHKSEPAVGSGEQELGGRQPLAANKVVNTEPTPRSTEKQQPHSGATESSRFRHANADQPAYPSVSPYAQSSADEREKPQPPKPIEKDDAPAAPVSILKNPQPAYIHKNFVHNGAAPQDTTADCQGHDNGHIHDSSGDSTGVDRKVSLKDRIRGEAKVVMGKLGNKEEKVQEGKRILSGVAQP